MMFKDTKQELDRLEQELFSEPQEEPPVDILEDPELRRLLQEDVPEEVPVPQEPAIRNFANGYQAYNTDGSDLDLDGYSDEVYQGQEGPRLRGLVIAVLLLTCGILTVVLWWVLRFKGIL